MGPRRLFSIVALVISLWLPMGRLSMPCFVFGTPQSPILFVATNGIYKVGRSSDADFVVSDTSISRQHAELRVDESGLQVIDLGSRNGTFVDNLQIQMQPVNHGQTVRFGAVAFMVAASAGFSDDETNANKSYDRIRKHLPAIEKKLSAAQYRVFVPLLEGLSEKATSKLLELSKHTVHNHIRAIFRVFGVHSRPQLLATVLKSNDDLLPGFQ